MVYRNGSGRHSLMSQLPEHMGSNHRAPQWFWQTWTEVRIKLQLLLCVQIIDAVGLR